LNYLAWAIISAMGKLMMGKLMNKKIPAMVWRGFFFCGLVHAPIRGEDWPVSEKKTRPNGDQILMIGISTLSVVKGLQK
jgi:hypothetical protein